MLITQVTPEKVREKSNYYPFKRSQRVAEWYFVAFIAKHVLLFYFLKYASQKLMKFELLWIFHVGFHVPDLIHQLTFTSSSNMSQQAPQNCVMYCITVPPAGESVEIHELVLKTVVIEEISLNHL